MPQLRRVSRSTRPSLSPAPAFNWTSLSDDPTYLAQLEPIFDGLCKAGVPEQWQRPLCAILAVDVIRCSRPMSADDAEHSARGAANRGDLWGGVVEPIGDGLARAAGSAEKDGLQRQKFGRSKQDAPSLVR